MYGYLKNVANQTVGFFLANCCGTPVIGATVTVYRSIDGGSQVAATGTVGEIGNGQYVLEMSQADTNGDAISFLFAAPSAVSLEKTIVTMSATTLGGSGISFKDAREFGRYTSPSSLLLNITPQTSNTEAVASDTQFWTNLVGRGTALNTNFAANTYKSVYSASGVGFVYSVVGPTAGGAETTTFEFTVDGVVTEISVLCASGQRAVLQVGGDYTNSTYIVGSGYSQSPGTFDAGKAIVDCSQLYMRHWMGLEISGVPRLKYDTSFSLRIKHSANVTGTGSQERQSGLMHRVLA